MFNEQYTHPVSNKIIRKNAQISCFACLISKALIQQAIRKNAQITVTSFYGETSQTLCMLDPDELHADSV